MKSTISEIVSEVNAAAVAEEGTAGEVVEEMTELEIMEAEDLTVEDLDTQDHHGDAIPEIEDLSVHYHPENRIHMCQADVVDVDKTNAGDLVRPSRLLLRLSGPIPNHDRRLAVEKDRPQYGARQYDADLGL